MPQKLIAKNRFVDFDLAFTKAGDSPPYDIALKKDINSIQQSIKNIILTSLGEKPFNRTFGGNLVDLLFDNVADDSVIADLFTQIQYTLKKHEPRVILDSIDVDTDNMDKNMLSLDLAYILAGEPQGDTGLTRSLTIELRRVR